MNKYEREIARLRAELDQARARLAELERQALRFEDEKHNAIIFTAQEVARAMEQAVVEVYGKRGGA